MTTHFELILQNLAKFYGEGKVYRILSKNRALIKIYRKSRLLRKVNTARHIFVSDGLVIMGRPVISPYEWEKRKAIELKSKAQKISRYLPGNSISLNFTENRFTDSDFQLGVIVSIYRPNGMLSTFLGNLEEQSIFESTEVIMVLVDPVPMEIELITSFCMKYTNAKLVVIEKRITIYEAWNIAIQQTKAQYLTNMNVDDLRSNDSLETQLMFMLDRPWVDVGFQDFYFMLDRDLDWESVVRLGAKSDLPPVTLLELAWFGINPPHNAPIWRRDLHDRYGEFDVSLKSAGDYEFWMRVLSKGAIFVKMPVSTIGYYINPKGMSTSSDSPSSQEERALQEKYKRAIETSSSILPELKIPERYKSNPWDASEKFTEFTLEELKRVLG